MKTINQQGCIAKKKSSLFSKQLRIQPEKIKGTHWPNFLKYERSVSNGFLYALKACFVKLELH